MREEQEQETDGQPPRKRRVQRIRIACVRCRQRKSRCDAVTPKCTPCANAHVPCVYDGFFPGTLRGQHDLSELPLSSPVIDERLKARIEQLELLLRREAPHVELPPAETVSVIPPPDPHADTNSNGLAEDAAVSRDHSSTAAALPNVDNATDSFTRGNLSHQVGLVSLSAGTDPKYIGPSSGYFLTKLLSCAPSKADGNRTAIGGVQRRSGKQHERDLAIEIFRDATHSLPSEEAVQRVSKTYFETIHLQFPFLHEPTHRRLVRQAFQSSPSKFCLFQVTMVLSLSAMILSRRSRVELPAAGWCAAAMTHFSDVQVEGSVQGLQCLLLLLIYAMHSPSSRFNAWHINYQCIAMVLDLGLQRDCSSSPMSRLQKEMRTRIFWVVYSLDRKLGTMMGRPIGLRDEACDLRLPSRYSDDDLGDSTAGDFDRVTHVDFAIHFFRLSKVVSEMKYVLHSVRRETPSYAFPAIRDIVEWQDSAISRLDDWHSSIPRAEEQALQYGESLCQVQYFTTKMLLLLPTPGIPKPRSHCLAMCYESSVRAIRLFNVLYSEEMLVYNWATCHSVILHAFSILYCATTVSDLSRSISTHTLSADLRAASNILSAIGEYWAGAKRTRDLLDSLTTSTLQNIRRQQQQQGTTTGETMPPNVAGDLTSSAMAAENHHPEDSAAQVPSLESLFAGFNSFEGAADLPGNDFDFGSLFIDAIDFAVSSNGLLDFGD